MKKTINTPWPLLILLFLVSASAPAQEMREPAALLQIHQRAQELLLVEKGEPYFICDMSEGFIELKIKGIVLRRWSADSTCLSGDPIPPVPRTLQARKAARLPQRDRIQPGQPPAPAVTRSGEFQLTSYELEDMPESYNLYFNGPVELKIVSTENHRKTGLQRLLQTLGREAVTPLSTVISRLRGRRYTRIDWAVSQADEARALYWACNDKTPWIFLINLR